MELASMTRVRRMLRTLRHVPPAEIKLRQIGPGVGHLLSNDASAGPSPAQGQPGVPSAGSCLYCRMRLRALDAWVGKLFAYRNFTSGSWDGFEGRKGGGYACCGTNRELEGQLARYRVRVDCEGHRELMKDLVDNGQSHIFSGWANPGVDDDKKQHMMSQ
eukprot:567036-Amorphochlora_amoeboformis.AAC.3